MSLVFIVLLFLLFCAGIMILIGSAGKYATYAETDGEIVEGLVCNPCEEPDTLSGKVKKNSREAVVIAYQVEGKTYHLATNFKKTSGAMEATKRIPILYNPYVPAEARLKEGSPFLGAVLVVMALAGLVGYVFLL